MLRSFLLVPCIALVLMPLTASAQDARKHESTDPPLYVEAEDGSIAVSPTFHEIGTGDQASVSIVVTATKGGRALTTMHQFECATGLSRIVYAEGQQLDSGDPINFFYAEGAFTETPELLQGIGSSRCRQIGYQ